jgi:putative transposase
MAASADKLRKLNQALSRKKKGSKNKEKVCGQLNVVQTNIKNARKDFLHKLSTKLISENQVIVCEDLQVKNLMKRCKPNKMEDGSFAPNGQAAKGGMNRSFADAGLGMLVSMLEYKAERSGRTLLKVPAHFTSKTCNACGSINSELKLSDREWICSDCGTEHERDHNAAKNVLAKGMKILEQQYGGGTRLLHLENSGGASSCGDIPEVLGAEEPIHTRGRKVARA